MTGPCQDRLKVLFKAASCCLDDHGWLSARVEAQSSLDLFMCRNRKKCIDVFKAKCPGTCWFFLLFKCITTYLKHDLNQIWRWWYSHVTTMVQSIRLWDITLHGPQGNRISASCFLLCFSAASSLLLCLFRCHLSSLPHFHFPRYLLHPYCSQRQRTHELHS